MKKASGASRPIWPAVLACISMLAVFSALTAAAPRGANMKVSAKVETPRVIVVRTHHDMCPVCKGIGPKFQEIIEQNEDSILFVTLDLTTETTQKQAAWLVGALGLESVWTGDLSKIGSATCVDGNSKEVLSSVQTDDMSKIRSTLRKAVALAKR